MSQGGRERPEAERPPSSEEQLSEMPHTTERYQSRSHALLRLCRVRDKNINSLIFSQNRMDVEPLER